MVANSGKSDEVYNVGDHNKRPNIFIVKTIIEQLRDHLNNEQISDDLIKHAYEYIDGFHIFNWNYSFHQNFRVHLQKSRLYIISI